RERERRPDPDLALHPDPPAVELDELATERQAKASAFDLLRRRPDLTELLEDRLLILGSDADAGVGHRDLHQVVHDPCPNVDASMLRRELHGIREEVE